MNKKILIVDDEKAIVDILSHNLKREGYDIVEAYDGEQAIQLANENKPDIILLDVMLPIMDGFSVCKIIRQTHNMPIIMITAKEDVVDKVIGLELGADDYITKPFSVREVIARIKANLRKSGVVDNKELKGEEKQIIDLGSITLNLEKYEVKVRGKEIDLTLREFELLKFLAMQEGQVFSREALLEKVWGYEYFGDVRTVDVTIRRIREKIEKDPSNPEFLATKRGVGYYFSK